MSPSAASSRKDWMICFLIAFLGMAISSQSITPGHKWGDDYAGYLLQAIAIENCDMEDELDLNRSLLLETPYQIGPYAYPWGFPMLLWAASNIVGFDIYRLKFITQVVAVFFTGIFIFLLARFYLSPLLSALATSLIIFQPFVIVFTDRLVADLPFLAISSLTIYLIELFHRQFVFSLSKKSVLFIFFIALLSIIAFSIRSQGAFLALTYLAIGCFVFFQEHTKRPQLAVSIVIFLIVYCIFLALYFKIFPDGSLVHANNLTVDPSSILRRLRETIGDFHRLIPIYPFSGIFTLIVMIPVGVLTLSGIYVGLPISAGMLVWEIFNTLLMLLYKYGDEPRYIFPLLIPISIFSLVGSSFILKKIYIKTSFTFSPLLRNAFISCLIVTMMISSIIFKFMVQWAPGSGPYTKEMNQVVAFTQEHIPEDAKVAFFKPRAFRLLTGRRSIIVNEASQIKRIDYYVLNKKVGRGYDPIRKAGYQISSEYFEDSSRDTFDKMFENDHYIIFKRK